MSGGSGSFGTVNWAELEELVPLVADFYERHGRDADRIEYAVLVMQAKANAAASSQIAQRAKCPPARPGGR